jgi:CIC family chloride channel protein
MQRVYLKLVSRRKEFIGDRSFMILLSIQVGFLAALAAMFLKFWIHFIETDGIRFLPPVFYFLFPVVGIFLVVTLYRYVFINSQGFHGIAGVLESIRRKSSIIHYSLMYAQLVTGAITIGLGGSSGLESPTVVTGSAIGSNASRFFRLDYKFRTLFIGCGTAATIAAIFNAPIAGVIFATEVILPQFSATIFIPILISSATGAFFSKLLMGGNVLFRVDGITAFTLQEIPLLMALGFFCGMVSLYYTKIFTLVKVTFRSFKNVWIKALTGGLILGLLIFLFPVLFGEGYVGITDVIGGNFQYIWQESVFGAMGDNAWNVYLVFFLLILLKPLAASITVNSGGEGGQFAPSFVTGGLSGFFFFLIATRFLPESQILNPTNYVLLGMGAVLAGVMHAPLTGIFLVAEVTQSYELFIGLMIVTAVSFFTKFYFDREVIHFKGNPSTRDLDATKHEFISLNNVRTADLVQRNPSVLYTDEKATRILEVMSDPKIKILAVLDRDGIFQGMITDHQLRKLAARMEEIDQITVAQIMTEAIATVEIREQMDLVVRKFDLYEVEYLPVFSKTHFVGFISRLSVLTSFREALKTSSDFLSENS